MFPVFCLSLSPQANRALATVHDDHDLPIFCTSFSVFYVYQVTWLFLWFERLLVATFERPGTSDIMHSCLHASFLHSNAIRSIHRAVVI
jgi:hypothetical protein